MSQPTETPKPEFSTYGNQILKRGETVARAISATLAKRIARSLNEMQPTRREATTRHNGNG